ncbi:MAG: hypothetical protein ACFFDW_10455 [Candidatus Thorarchaeota archaeon]
MSEIEKNFDNRYTEDFRKITQRISRYFSKEVNTSNKNIYVQDSNSSIEIPKQGINFGIIIENDKIILANWLNDLSRNEKKALIHFLLSKEVIRNILLENYVPNNISKNFFEVILNCLTTLWCIEDWNLTSYYDRNIGFINQRMPFGFDSNVNLLWEKKFINIYFSELPIKDFFDKIYYLTQQMIHGNLPFEKIELSINDFMNSFEPNSETPFLPIYLKERYLQIFEFIYQTGFRDISAKKIGEKIGKKHDVINDALKEITGFYMTYWLPQINYQVLKLYPSTIQLTIHDKQTSTELLKSLHKIPYIINLFEEQSNEKQTINAIVQSPLIVQNQLEELFEKYSKKGKISDYSLLTPIKQAIFGTVSTENIIPTSDIFTKLMLEPESLPIKTFKFVEKTTEIDFSKKAKKAFFAEEVLGYLASMRARFLPQGMYDFRRTEFVELLTKFNVDSTKTEEVMKYINKMEHRCCRLGLLDYRLILWVKSNHLTNISFELMTNPRDKRVEELTNNLKSFSTLTKVEFKDRVTFTLQGIRYNKELVEAIKKQISSYGFDCKFYEFQRNIDFQRCLCLHKLYDYENSRWKF